jgi:hypothetical protein
MSVAKLILPRPLQSVISLSARSCGIFPSDVREIAQCQTQAKSYGADVDGMSGSVERCILAEIRERGYERAAISDGDDEPKSSGFDIMRCQVVTQPGEDQRRAREDASCDEEGAAIPHSRCFGRELHDVADRSEGETGCDERTAHLDAVADPRRHQHNEKGEEVRRYGEQLSCDALVSEASDDGRKEERVRVDWDKDEEEVDAHHDRVDVKDGHADLQIVSDVPNSSMCSQS